MADGGPKLAVAALWLAAAVSAIAPTALAADSSETVDVVAGKPLEFSYTLRPRQVLTGTVTFIVHNAGLLPHDFAMRGRESGLVAPGATVVFTVRFPTPGVYEYVSMIRGQQAAGMTGELTVLPRPLASKVRSVDRRLESWGCC
jgi:uncharacterized cupredoxin-like copper-binding protein